MVYGLWPMDGIRRLKKKTEHIKSTFCTFAADGSPGKTHSIFFSE